MGGALAFNKLKLQSLIINFTAILLAYLFVCQKYLISITDNSRIIIELFMTQRIKILEDDIAELKQLTLQAESPRIQNHLAQLLSQFKTELEQVQSAINTSQLPKKQTVPTPINDPTSDLLKYTSLTKYAWDQQGTKVKLIFSLDGVGKECTTDQLDVIFTKDSVELRLRGYRNQNLIFAIKRLFAEIVTSESKYLLKNNSLNLVLTKKENKSWSQIAFKEDKLAKTEKPEKEADKEDPSAGIMGMMKKMYEEGDENMKRTIAEAWTKANDKKTGGEKPDFSDRYDFLKK